MNALKNLFPVTLGYSLDAVGNRTSFSVDGIPTHYSYDALNELTEARLGPIGNKWTYDAVGNRTSEALPGFRSVTSTYDADDRLLTSGRTTFAYDADGNQISEQPAHGPATTYAYDAANRLIEATVGKTASSFDYDGDGDRIRQSVGTGTYDYLNDVATALPVVLQESGPDGNISYAYGLGLISESGPKFDYFYHYDGLGSVVTLSNAMGRPAAAYLYDPWGNPLLAIPDSVGTRNKFRFTGEALDPGTGLYYLRARYYDTSTGRLNSVDPLSFVLNRQLPALRYAYASNNPTNRIDPTGEFSWSWIGPQAVSLTTTYLKGLVTDSSIILSKATAAATKALVSDQDALVAAAQAASLEAGGSAAQFFKLNVIGTATGYLDGAVTEYLISNFGQDQLVHVTGLELATGFVGGLVGSVVGPEGTVVGAAIGGIVGSSLNDLLIPKLAK